MRTFWIMAGYALVAALGLTGFVLVDSLFRYVISLITFLAGLRFFSNHDSWKLRFAFIGLSLALWVVLFIFYFIIGFCQGWPIPGDPDRNVCTSM